MNDMVIGQRFVSCQQKRNRGHPLYLGDLGEIGKIVDKIVDTHLVEK